MAKHKEAIDQSDAEALQPLDAQVATAWFYRLLRNALVDHYPPRRASEKLQPQPG